MSYQDFLNTLISPIQLFVSALSQVADSLIHNYIFITILGIGLFISLFWLVYYFFTNFINSKIDDIEDKIDRYNDYELYKETQREYLDKHRVDEFMYLYDLTILKQQVMNGIYRNNPDVLLDNITQFNKLKAKALKSIKKEYESDDNPSNDDDIDYIVPTPPIEKASVEELKKALKNSESLSFGALQEYSNDLKSDINSEIDRIMDENKEFLFWNVPGHHVKYDKKSNSFYDFETGEILDFSKYIKKDNDKYTDEDLSNMYYMYKKDFGKHFAFSFDEYLKKYIGVDFNSISPDLLKKYSDIEKKNTIYPFQKTINLGHFAYYDKESKEMKRIALPIIPGKDNQDFQFDNDNLSDKDREFVSNHTLIKL